MKTQDFWQTFTQTGSIYDYLSYKSQENLQRTDNITKVCENEHQNKCGSCENKEYRQ